MQLPFGTGRRSISLSILAAIAAGFALGAAAAEPSPGEKAVTYRKAVYQVILWQVGPLGAMAQGKAPYDPDEFARRAGRLNTMTYMLEEAYPPESQGVRKSKAKSKIWQNRADFDAKLKALEEKSAELAQVARQGDFETSKEAFFATANACKNCHDEYRSD
jgi:cytochrome c556